MELKQGYKKTEVGVIPDDWTLKLVGDCFLIHNNLRLPLSRDVRKSMQGQYPYYGPTKIQDYINEYRVDGKYALIGEDGDHFLKWEKDSMTQLVTGKFNVNNHAHLLKGNGKETTTEWFYYYFKHRDITSYLARQGAGRYKLSKGTLVTLPCAYPDITEQRAIAQVLSDTDALIQALEKKIAKKKSIKKGVMQKLLTPKEGWEVKTIKEVATYRRGSFPQPYGLPQWYDKVTGMPFIQVVDVDKNFKLKRETKQKISSLGAEMSVFVKKGSIILTIQGSIGRICITDYDAYVDRTLLIFESFKEDFDKYFFMLSIWLKFQIEKQHAPGGIIKTITKEALSSFEIAYPKKEEQISIAKTLFDIDKEIEQLEKKLSKYKQAKQGMMQQLLTGKIRLV